MCIQVPKVLGVKILVAKPKDLKDCWLSWETPDPWDLHDGGWGLGGRQRWEKWAWMQGMYVSSWRMGTCGSESWGAKRPGKEIWEMMPSSPPPSFSESQWADCSVFIRSYSLRRSLSTQLTGIPTGESSVYLGAALAATLITSAPEVREQP